MEAECIPFSQAMRDLIPICAVLQEINATGFQLQPRFTYHAHSKIFEEGNAAYLPRPLISQSTVSKDNVACLKFARMPWLTPRIKQIGIPYDWFREHVELLHVRIERASTANQLADCFTKTLSAQKF